MKGVCARDKIANTKRGATSLHLELPLTGGGPCDTCRGGVQRSGRGREGVLGRSLLLALPSWPCPGHTASMALQSPHALGTAQACWASCSCPIHGNASWQAQLPASLFRDPLQMLDMAPEGWCHGLQSVLPSSP